jgi:hypothetical protein
MMIVSKDTPRPRSRRNTGSGAIILRDISAATHAANTSKVMIIAHFAELVRAGLAEWTRLDTGATEVRLGTGEVFVLGDTAVTRLS